MGVSSSTSHKECTGEGGQMVLTATELLNPRTNPIFHNLAISPQCRWLGLINSEGNCLIYRLNDLKHLFDVSQLTRATWSHTVSFSPDEQHVVVGSGWITAGFLTVFELVNMAIVHAFEAHSQIVIDTRFSPMGDKLVSASSDGTAFVWDTATWTKLHAITHDDGLLACAFSPDNIHVATSGYDCRAKIFDTEKGVVVHDLVGHDAAVTAVAFSSDGKILATGTGVGEVRLFEVESGRMLLCLNPSNKIQRVNSVGFSSDDVLVFVCTDDGTVSLIRRFDDPERDHRVVMSIKVHDGPFRAAISPNINKLYTCGEDKHALIVDIDRPTRPYRKAFQKTLKFMASTSDRVIDPESLFSTNDFTALDTLGFHIYCALNRTYGVQIQPPKAISSS